MEPLVKTYKFTFFIIIKMVTLVSVGWKELRLERALKLYRDGRVSIDRAAKVAGLIVSEMMKEAAATGIKSEETAEEYQRGVKTLLGERD